MLLDDIRIYDTALTAGEIAALVPEPDSVAVVLLGGALLGARAARRRATRSA